AGGVDHRRLLDAVGRSDIRLALEQELDGLDVAAERRAHERRHPGEVAKVHVRATLEEQRGYREITVPGGGGEGRVAATIARVGIRARVEERPRGRHPPGACGDEQVEVDVALLRRADSRTHGEGQNDDQGDPEGHGRCWSGHRAWRWLLWAWTQLMIP